MLLRGSPSPETPRVQGKWEGVLPVMWETLRDGARHLLVHQSFSFHLRSSLTHIVLLTRLMGRQQLSESMTTHHTHTHTHHTHTPHTHTHTFTLTYPYSVFSFSFGQRFLVFPEKVRPRDSHSQAWGRGEHPQASRPESWQSLPPVSRREWGPHQVPLGHEKATTLPTSILL